MHDRAKGVSKLGTAYGIGAPSELQFVGQPCTTEKSNQLLNKMTRQNGIDPALVVNASKAQSGSSPKAAYTK
eukprot:141924-Chlamydomonas_euryale.AAC.1